MFGDELKCPECGEFGRVRNLKMNTKSVLVELTCEDHRNSYEASYTHPDFQKLCEMGLIDPPDIKTYQLKYAILTGQYVKLRDGIDRILILDDVHFIQKVAQTLLLCGKCSGLVDLQIREIKIPKPKKRKKKVPTIVVDQRCTVCHKHSAVEIELEAFAGLVKTGLMEPDVGSDFREKLAMEEWTPDESYGMTSAVLAPHAAEALGLTGQRENKCRMCGTPVAKGLSRCPNCGNDMDV